MNFIPKHIYTFWHSEKLPSLVKHCVGTWKKFNPDYKITIINENNYNNYTSIDVKLLRNFSLEKKQRTSDFVRTCVLKEHGGVWMDATIICTDSLNTILNNSKNFLAYTMHGKLKYPIIENWFFACTKGNEFMMLWYDEFIIRANKFSSFKDYIDDRKKYVNVPIRYITEYFSMHISAQYIIQKLKYPLKELTLLPSFSGPFKIQKIYKGNNERIMNFLCYKDRNKRPKPIIKLIKKHRVALQKNPDKMDCIFGNKKKFRYKNKFLTFLAIFISLSIIIVVYCLTFITD